MREARARLGISYEEVARRVSRFGYELKAKTYERWEQRGMVRQPALRPVATVLGIEIEEPDPVRVRIDGTGLTGSERQRLADVLELLNQTMAEMVRLIEDRHSVEESMKRSAAHLERAAAAIARREASGS